MDGVTAAALPGAATRGTLVGGPWPAIAPAAAPGARVLVALHDVTPAHAAAVRVLWDVCRAHGTTPALCVVPDWHGRWPLEADRAFVAWLHARAADGAEVLLHGLRHDEVGLPRGRGLRGWRVHARAAGRTAREGEFLTLGRAAARARLAAGCARLRTLGFDPVGFVPPAWLMRPACVDAVADVGLAYTEDARAVYLVRPARPLLGPATRALPAPAWRWSTRTPLRAWAGVGVAAARWWAHPERRVLLRVALHPGDAGHAATRRSVEHTLARLQDVGVRPAPYAALARGRDDA